VDAHNFVETGREITPNHYFIDHFDLLTTDSNMLQASFDPRFALVLAKSRPCDDFRRKDFFDENREPLLDQLPRTVEFLRKQHVERGDAMVGCTATFSDNNHYVHVHWEGVVGPKVRPPFQL